MNGLQFCIARARHSQGLAVAENYGEQWTPAPTTRPLVSPRLSRGPRPEIVRPADFLPHDESIIQMLSMIPDGVSVREAIGLVKSRVCGGQC